VDIANDTLVFEIKEKLIKMSKAAKKKLGLLDEVKEETREEN
jgi:hypothetical protein